MVNEEGGVRKTQGRKGRKLTRDDSVKMNKDRALQKRIDKLAKRFSIAENWPKAEWYSLVEVGELLSCTRQAVYYMIKRGELVAEKHQGVYEIRLVDLARFIRSIAEAALEADDENR